MSRGRQETVKTITNVQTFSYLYTFMIFIRQVLHMNKENQIEENLIEQLNGLKYIHRPDILDRKSLEQNFKTKLEALNRVRLSDSEFLRLREEIIQPDVFKTSKLLRERQYHITGQSVLSTQVDASGQVDISGLQDGVYIVRCLGSDGTSGVSKIIKQ